MLNESLVKYLAGLLDADGSLSFNFGGKTGTDHHYVKLTLKLASSEAVDKTGFVAGLPELTSMGVVHREGRNAQFINWTVTKRADLEMLLPRLIKHMVIKAKHWQWLLDTWREIRSGNQTISTAERERLTSQSKLSRQQNVGPVHPKNHPTWAWLAGYIDGDGWYNYRKNLAKTTGYWQWSMKIAVAAHNNDASVIDFLHKALGGHVRAHSNGTMQIWEHGLGYQNRSFALNVLPKLAKHSRLKRDKIEAIIHHHRQRLSVPGVSKKTGVSDSLT